MSHDIIICRPSYEKEGIWEVFAMLCPSEVVMREMGAENQSLGTMQARDGDLNDTFPQLYVSYGLGGKDGWSESYIASQSA